MSLDCRLAAYSSETTGCERRAERVNPRRYPARDTHPEMNYALEDGTPPPAHHKVRSHLLALPALPRSPINRGM